MMFEQESAIPSELPTEHQKFDSDGDFLLKCGSAGTGDGQFYAAVGVVTDGKGNVFVVDRENLEPGTKATAME